MKQRDQAVEPKYRHIAATLGPGDVIVADAITDNPLAQGSFPINQALETLAPYDPSKENNLTYDRRVDDARKRAEDARQAIVERAITLISSSSGGVLKTKILDSTLLAERVFHTYQLPRKILVLCSDMLEESDTLNFRRQPPRAQTAGRMIAPSNRPAAFPIFPGSRCTSWGRAPPRLATNQLRRRSCLE